MNHERSYYSNYSGCHPGGHSTKTVKRLIIINVGLFVLVQLFPGISWLGIFGLVPRYVFGRLMIWQLASYMFIHLGLWHLTLNMLMLWFFGPAIERAWGSRRFLFFYFFTGIGAGLCSFIAAFNSAVPVIGASGAIFGLLLAYALMFPETIILLFFFFPMKIRHAVFVLVVINLLGALSAPQSGIAYFAHLGGGLFGYLYLKSEWIRRRLAYWDFARRDDASRKRKRQTLKAQPSLEQQVDKILDKISRRGIESLSRKEQKILRDASKSGLG